MAARTALVLGSGLAGPVVAMALQRVGIRPLVIEARESLGLPEGAFLGVAPNGMNALSVLDLASPIAELGIPCSAFAFVNADDRALGRIDRGADVARFGWPLTMLRRADLHRSLHEAATLRAIPIRRGARVRHLHDSEDGVRVTLADGEILEADLAVGCDGINSITRASLFPGAPAPRDSGLLDCGGFAPFAPSALAVGVNHMVFGRRAFFGAFRTPNGETWWFHNGPTNAGALRERLLELHRDDPPWITDLIQATPRVLGPWPLRALDALPRWSRGRICLIGDAAHAMSPSAGQGASLAFEDALVLAQCLRDHAEHAAAFARFEALRRARVTAIAEQAARQSNDKAPSAVGAWFRDLLLPWFLRLGANQQNRSYDFRIEWDANVAG